MDRENFAQDIGENDVRVTTADGFEGVALTDDNVRNTVRLNIDKTKPTITQPYEEFQNRTTLFIWRLQFVAYFNVSLLTFALATTPFDRNDPPAAPNFSSSNSNVPPTQFKNLLGRSFDPASK
jgi:hypothetical protein